MAAPFPLLQRNKPRRMCSSDTRPSVLDWLVTDAEFPKIEPHHLRLDFHLIKLFATVDSDHRSNHLWHHNHVSQMCFHQIRLLVWLGRLFGFSQFLDQTHRLALQTAVESAASSGVDDISELFGAKVKESVKREKLLETCMRGKGAGQCSFLLIIEKTMRNETYWSRSMPR